MIFFFFFSHSLLCSVPSLISLEETKLYIGVDYGKPQLRKFLVKLLMKPVVSCCCDECSSEPFSKALLIFLQISPERTTVRQSVK